MTAVEIVLITALIEYEAMGLMAGRARLKFKVEAPATVGHPIFERYYRVHQNTLEQLIIFVPALIIFALTVSAAVATVLGGLFIVARALYAIGYIRDPKQRLYGAGSTVLINGTLLVGGLVGLLITL